LAVDRACASFGSADADAATRDSDSAQPEKKIRFKIDYQSVRAKWLRSVTIANVALAAPQRSRIARQKNSI
jgi:hypothetical protein